MTDEAKKLRAVLLPNVLAWVALMILLGLTFGSAYIPLGTFNLVVSLIIAGIKVLIVAFVFMSLRRPDTLLRMAAAAAFFWLLTMFVLTFSDYLTRSIPS